MGPLSTVRDHHPTLHQSRPQPAILGHITQHHNHGLCVARHGLPVGGGAPLMLMEAPVAPLVEGALDVPLAGALPDKALGLLLEGVPVGWPPASIVTWT